jgi:hypothetical protein
MVKKRKSNNRLEKDRQDSCERVLIFAQKKVEEQAVKDSLARKHALELLGLTQEFNYSDHSKSTTTLIMPWRPLSLIERVDRSTRSNVWTAWCKQHPYTRNSGSQQTQAWSEFQKEGCQNCYYVGQANDAGTLCHMKYWKFDYIYDSGFRPKCDRKVLSAFLAGSLRSPMMATPERWFCPSERTGIKPAA